jgi:hypothetical protein
MKVRTSILLDDELVTQLRMRAVGRGTSVTQEIREAVVRYLADDDPNRGLKALIGLWASDREWPEVDSDESKDEFVDYIERDSFGRDLDGSD